MQNNNTKTVCVVGSGLTGLVTAKVFSRNGFHVTVYEKANEIGGVWREENSYPDLTTNNPKHTYEFSDFPIQKEASEWITAPQFRHYLHSYAAAFHLRELVHLNTTVVSVKQLPPVNSNTTSRWSVITRLNGKESEKTFDYVIVCTGMFCEPNMPEISGLKENFRGRITHTSQLRDMMSDIQNKRVVVLGFGKSALDCATVCQKYGAQSVTSVFRRASWMLPRRLNGVHPKWLSSRFGESLAPWHEHGPLEQLVHYYGKNFVTKHWKSTGDTLRQVFKITSDSPLSPDLDLPYGMSRIGMNDGIFYEMVHQGKIKAIKSWVAKCTGPSTIQLENGQSLEADVIVYGTGFKLEIPFLEQGVRSQVFDQDNNIYLYRNLLPVAPALRSIAFNGFCATISNSMTSEIGAHWLAQLFQGNFQLPSEEVMRKSVSDRLSFLKEFYPECQGTHQALIVSHYLDKLVTDMGLSPIRTSNFVQEYFFPNYPENYRHLESDLARLAAEKNSQKQKQQQQQLAQYRFYFSFYHFLALLLVLYIWFFKL